jgi:hypothetical protein
MPLELAVALLTMVTTIMVYLFIRLRRRDPK